MRKAGWVVVLALLASALSVYTAFFGDNRLSVDPDFSNLIPEHYPSVQALERIRATVGGGETTVDMAIESPSFEANLAFAEALVPKALALHGDGYDEPYFIRAELRRDTEFLQDNALYFATDAEIDQLETYLNDKIEEAKLEANPFFFDLDEEDEADGEDAAAEEMKASYEAIVGHEYRVSPDSTTLVVRFFPAGSSTNVDYIETLYGDFEALIATINPQAYHTDMETTLAGRLWRQRIEVRAITDDVLGSFGVGMLCVLLTVVSYFFYKAYRVRAGRRFDRGVFLPELLRAPVMALVIALPLLMSLTWTFGVAYLAFGTLNLMTSTLGLVLFGLGIDYGIHFYARYAEERGAGRSIVDAAEQTFVSTGQAITVGALTTAAALYVLIVADFKGFSEFGFIAGTGVLFALVAMIVVMPALLAVFERLRLIDLLLWVPFALLWMPLALVIVVVMQGLLLQLQGIFVAMGLIEPLLVLPSVGSGFLSIGLLGLVLWKLTVRYYEAFVRRVLAVLERIRFKGFSEFGLIAGTGVLFALVALALVMVGVMLGLLLGLLLVLQAIFILVGLGPMGLIELLQAIFMAIFIAMGQIELLQAIFIAMGQIEPSLGIGLLGIGLLGLVLWKLTRLTVLERIRLLNLESAAPAAPETMVVQKRFPAVRAVVLVSLVTVMAALAMAPRVEFEYRFGELEPTYEEWIKVNSRVRQAYSDRSRRNPAYVVVDTPEEVPVVVAAVRQKMEQDTTRRIVDADTFYTTIRAVESLQERFPLTEAEQQRKLARIAAIRALLADPFIEGEESEDLVRLRRAAQTQEAISEDDVPEFLRKQFTSKSGELGNFITIFPSVGLSDGRKSIAFAEDVGAIVTDEGRTYHAGSPSIVGADMLRLMQREAPYMVLATFVIVALLMWANFGRVRWAALAVLPLMVGVLWMLLLMEVFGLRLSFYNMVVLPAVLGIGNDAGAHMVHRYREEGPGSIMTVLRSTGEHVTMGAVTTMIGFGGLILSFHPGLNSIGELAVTGIGTTLLAALVFLPALLQVLEDRHTAAPVEDAPTTEAPATVVEP